MPETVKDHLGQVIGGNQFVQRLLNPRAFRGRAEPSRDNQIVIGIFITKRKPHGIHLFFALDEHLRYRSGQKNFADAAGRFGFFSTSAVLFFCVLSGKTAMMSLLPSAFMLSLRTRCNSLLMKIEALSRSIASSETSTQSHVKPSSSPDEANRKTRGSCRASAARLCRFQSRGTASTRPKCPVSSLPAWERSRRSRGSSQSVSVQLNTEERIIAFRFPCIFTLFRFTIHHREYNPHLENILHHVHGAVPLVFFANHADAFVPKPW